VSQRLGTLSDVITLDIPVALSARVQNALKANPRTVELRALATHFYGLGERVLALFEEEVLCDVLINVCLHADGEWGGGVGMGKGGGGVGADQQ